MGDTLSIALIGARGYVGRELLFQLAKTPWAKLTLATSRQYGGQRVSDVFDGIDSEVVFTESDPQQAARHQADVYFLGLPNGMAAPYVDAIDATCPEALIIDLSADYRHVSGWTYGLTDFSEPHLKGAKRIANPGCYATAAILSLFPIKDILAGPPSAFGVSGYSGAGTTPSRKNDPSALRNNIIPYGYQAHGHQKEISDTVGRSVRFTPHVASFFRGLMVSFHAPIIPNISESELIGRYRAVYDASETTVVQSALPEVAEVINTPKAIIGGLTLDPATNVLAGNCVLDNLLKGAASQALMNMCIATGREFRA